MQKLYKKTTILAILLIVFVMLIIFILGLNSAPSIQNIYSYTKAICDSKNFCQDYEIHCQNEKPIKISPITGAAVQFPPSWKDPRDENSKNKIC